MSEIFILMKPEITVIIILFLIILIKLGMDLNNRNLLLIIQSFLFVNFVAGFFMNRQGAIFGGMYYTNALIAYQKSILSFGIFLISLIFENWFKSCKHLPEFFMLSLSALLGMFFLISARNMLLFYLSLELATIPVAAMVNFDLEKRFSSEAALKMILSSAFSSAILLFGISLIYGLTGTLYFAEIQASVNNNPLMIMAFIFILSAFAFKLSIVPFHLWTADVYQGAPYAVTSFLSVISKGAVAFIFITTLFTVFEPINQVWYNTLALISILTMITGNLFALRQQNIKRFLAFSSIAQIGFVLVGITGHNTLATASVVFFMLIYTLSNLAAFGVAALIESQTGKETINDYQGLYQTNPFLGLVFTFALFSLAGIPPTAGFFGKLFLIGAGASNGNYLFITVASLNMVISLYYYLKVVRHIFMYNNEQAMGKIHINPLGKLAFIVCTSGIVLLGFFSWIYSKLVAIAELTTI